MNLITSENDTVLLITHYTVIHDTADIWHSSVCSDQRSNVYSRCLNMTTAVALIPVNTKLKAHLHVVR